MASNKLHVINVITIITTFQEYTKTFYNSFCSSRYIQSRKNKHV